MPTSPRPIPPSDRSVSHDDAPRRTPTTHRPGRTLGHYARARGRRGRKGREVTVPENPARDSLPSPGAAARTTEAHDSLVSAWRARVARNPDAAALRYFDGVLSAREADAASDALAAAFEARGTRRGDRVGVYLQNCPAVRPRAAGPVEAGRHRAGAQPDVPAA
ncbi:AMP-binding protein [Streptomyces sp. e14]|uniref:AMP-binding protein n=1 Tax=Streptomyces sp. e14 TaxID=645465 RepID=UPI0022AFC7F5|nr:AMP-binding protein [Streptomyces sp. e14]